MESRGFGRSAAYNECACGRPIHTQGSMADSSHERVIIKSAVFDMSVARHVKQNESFRSCESARK
jgi:hypothetical protein